MRLLGGKNSVSFVMWQAASFSIHGHKISSKTQNERWRWMGTGGRSICDNYIFRKHSQTHPGNPKIWQKIPWKTLEKNFISLLATLHGGLANGRGHYTHCRRHWNVGPS